MILITKRKKSIETLGKFILNISSYIKTQENGLLKLNKHEK